MTGFIEGHLRRHIDIQSNLSTGTIIKANLSWKAIFAQIVYCKGYNRKTRDGIMDRFECRRMNFDKIKLVLSLIALMAAVKMKIIEV